MYLVLGFSFPFHSADSSWACRRIKKYCLTSGFFSPPPHEWCILLSPLRKGSIQTRVWTKRHIHTPPGRLHPRTPVWRVEYTSGVPHRVSYSILRLKVTSPPHTVILTTPWRFEDCDGFADLGVRFDCLQKEGKKVTNMINLTPFLNTNTPNQKPKHNPHSDFIVRDVITEAIGAGANVTSQSNILIALRFGFLFSYFGGWGLNQHPKTFN